MRVDMYLLRDGAGDANELVCRLVGKAWPAHHAIQIACADQQRAQTVDQLLWSIPENRLIAHQIMPAQSMSTQTTVRAPVIIVEQPDNPESDSILVELRELDTVADNCKRFARVLDVVSNTEAARACARRRYHAYRQLTAELHTHELS